MDCFTQIKEGSKQKQKNLSLKLLLCHTFDKLTLLHPEFLNFMYCSTMCTWKMDHLE